MNYLRYIVIVISFIFIASCGYKITEKDKFPDMPLFPEGTNTNINIKKCDTGVFRYEVDGVFFDIGYTTKNEDSFPYLFYYNADLTKKDSIPVYKTYFIDENNMLYSRNPINNKAFKLDIRTGKKSKLLYYDFNVSEKYNKYLSELDNAAASEELKWPDSLKSRARTKRQYKAMNILQNKFKETVFTNLICARALKYNTDEYYLLKYDNREVLINGNSSSHFSSSYLFDLYEACESPRSYSFENISVINVFDTAVTENTLGGNRYKSTINQKGYQYIELEHNGEKTRFKLQVTNIEDTILSAYLTPDKKTVIIYNYDEKRYYKIE